MEDNQKLDEVLKYLDKFNKEYKTINEYSFSEEIRLELTSILAQLIEDGYILSKEIPKEGVHPGYGAKELVYLITTKGIAFVKKSSYKNESKKKSKNAIFQKIKDFGLFINGALLLACALLTVYIAKSESDYRLKNKQLEKQIDSLKKIIKEKNIPSLKDTLEIDKK